MGPVRVALSGTGVGSGTYRPGSQAGSKTHQTGGQAGIDIRLGLGEILIAQGP
jgi:hypothetical protein